MTNTTTLKQTLNEVKDDLYKAYKVSKNIRNLYTEEYLLLHIDIMNSYIKDLKEKNTDSIHCEGIYVKKYSDKFYYLNNMENLLINKK